MAPKFGSQSSGPRDFVLYSSRVGVQFLWHPNCFFYTRKAPKEVARVDGMYSGLKKKVRRASYGETYNRNGYWTRTFSFKIEAWPIIDHWASEHGYKIIAFRRNRRVYQKGTAASHFKTFIDIRQIGENVTLSAIVEASFVARLLRFFQIGPVMSIQPIGSWGVGKRRQVCRDLNTLLQRLSQPAIFESEGFHIADTDPTTWLLAALFSFPFAVYLYRTIFRIDVRPALTNSLLSLMGKNLGILVGTALAIIVAQQWISLKRREKTYIKFISFGAGLSLYVVLALFFVTRTPLEMTERKFAYYCVQHYNETACRKTFEELGPKHRAIISQRLQWLDQQLTVRPR